MHVSTILYDWLSSVKCYLFSYNLDTGITQIPNNKRYFAHYTFTCNIYSKNQSNNRSNMLHYFMKAINFLCVNSPFSSLMSRPSASSISSIMSLFLDCRLRTVSSLFLHPPWKCSQMTFVMSGSWRIFPGSALICRKCRNEIN